MSDLDNPDLITPYDPAKAKWPATDEEQEAAWNETQQLMGRIAQVISASTGGPDYTPTELNALALCIYRTFIQPLHTPDVLTSDAYRGLFLLADAVFKIAAALSPSGTTDPDTCNLAAIVELAQRWRPTYQVRPLFRVFVDSEYIVPEDAIGQARDNLVQDFLQVAYDHTGNQVWHWIQVEPAPWATAEHVDEQYRVKEGEAEDDG